MTHRTLTRTDGAPTDAMTTFRHIKWTRLSDYSFTRVLPSTIAGLHYVQDRRCAYKYFALVHTASGKTVASWRRGPVRAKDVEFVAAVDAAFAPLPVDWTRAESDLGINESIGRDIRRVAGLVVSFKSGEYRF